MKKIILIIFLGIYIGVKSQSTGDYRSASSGSWSTAATWERYNGSAWVTPGASPASLDGVITIRSGHTIDITSSVTVDQCSILFGGTVTVSSGGTSTLTIANGSGTDLELYGLLRLDAGGAISMSSGSNMTVNSGGVYQHNRNFVNGLPTGSNTTWNAGSLCLISSDITAMTTFVGHSFSRLNIDYITGTSARVFEANWPTSIDTLNIINTGSTGTLSIANSTDSRLRTLGTLIMDGGKFYIAGTSASGSGTLPYYSLTITNQLIQNGGELEINRSNTSGVSARPRISVNGNTMIHGGVLRIMNNSGTGMAIGELFVTGVLNISGGTLDLSAAGSINAGRCFVANNLNLSGGEMKYTQALTGSSGSSGVYFNRNGLAQTFTHSGGTLSTASGGIGRRFYYLTSSGPSGLNEVYSAITSQESISGDQGSPITNYAAWPISGPIIKNFTVNNNAGLTLRDNRIINDTLYRTAGSITGSGIIAYASGASLVYNGTAAMTTADKEFPSTNGPTNLVINNAGNITLHANRTISGNLNFLNGKLITDACAAATSSVNSSLTLADNATVTGANSFRFVDGILKKTGDDAFTFPVGSGSKYAPVGIAAPTVNTDRFAACYIGSNPNSIYSITSKAGSLNNVSKTEYWHINRENGSSNTNVTLSWDSRSGGVNNMSQLRVCRWNGTQWDDESNTGNTGNNSAGTVTSGSISSFSPFTLGSTSSANPLPVELIYFKANCQDKKKMVSWATASEKDNSHFIIAKSADAQIWIDIGRVEGHGNSPSLIDYSYEDTSVIKGKYYRLYQQDFEGSGEYFKVIYFDDKDCQKEFDIYFDDQNQCLRWYGKSNLDDIDMSIKDMLGREVYQPSTVDLGYLPAGIYYLRSQYRGETIQFGFRKR